MRAEKGERQWAGGVTDCLLSLFQVLWIFVVVVADCRNARGAASVQPLAPKFDPGQGERALCSCCTQIQQDVEGEVAHRGDVPASRGRAMGNTLTEPVHDARHVAYSRGYLAEGGRNLSGCRRDASESLPRTDINIQDPVRRMALPVCFEQVVRGGGGRDREREREAG